MTIAVLRLRWIDVYHYEANNLRVHGRRSESSHEYRRYMQLRVRDRLRKGSSRVQLSEYLEESITTPKRGSLMGTDPKRVNSYFQSFCCSMFLSWCLCHFTYQYLESIFRTPYDMVLTLPNCMC